MRPHRFAHGILVALAALLTTPGPAAAAWNPDPNTGAVVTANPGMSVSEQVAVSDGAGGAIVAWVQTPNGLTRSIFAQRVDVNGNLAWTAGGVQVCTGSGFRGSLTMVPDGSGGAILAWSDARSGAGDIYAQHLNAAGATLWTANGLALCTAANDQQVPLAASDGAGGALVFWTDYRNGNADLFGHRVTGAGALSWSAGGLFANGAPMLVAASNQSVRAVCSDGAGGAFLGWFQDNTTNYSMHYQHVSGSATVQWGSTGIQPFAMDNAQYNYTSRYPVALAPDGFGGVLVAYYHYYSGDGTTALFFGTLSAAGQGDSQGGRVSLTNSYGALGDIGLVPDGAGGACLVVPTGTGVIAQRCGASAELLWGASGISLGSGGSRAAAIADGLGGVIAFWNDGGLRAQRLSAAGVKQWGTSGVTLYGGGDVGAMLPVASSAGVVVVPFAKQYAGFDRVLTQRVDRFGSLGDAAPRITSVKDVPNDQGGRVKVSWSRSHLDAELTWGITEYRLWRSVPTSFALGATGARRAITADPDDAVANGRLWADPAAAGAYAWEWIATEPAAQLTDYSLVTSTESDSVPGSFPKTAFMVEARANTSLSTPRWTSAPDSGYSVDNVPPAAPSPFTGAYAGGTTALHWAPNHETDLAGYRLYRGTSAGFVPGPASLVAAITDTGYADPAGAPYVYKLTALDVHGNESLVATLTPSGALDVATGAPATLAFAAPSPNPARGRTVLRYALPRSGPVRLAVYDAAGRQVRALAAGAADVGVHAVEFDLRDGDGRALAPGLYLARLETAAGVLTRRLAVVR